MNEHNIPCFIRNIKILTVLVGIKSVISSLSVQIQVVHCFQINSLVNKASFFFLNKLKVDGKFIHFVVVYLFGLCFIFFMKKNANNVQLVLSLWRENMNVLFLFTTCYVYIHCGLLKEYTAYSIFKFFYKLSWCLIIDLIFFFSKQYLCHFGVLFWSWSKKTYLFKFFFILEIYSQSYFFRDMTFNFEQSCDLDPSFTFHSIWSCPL